MAVRPVIFQGMLFEGETESEGWKIGPDFESDVPLYKALEAAHNLLISERTALSNRSDKPLVQLTTLVPNGSVMIYKDPITDELVEMQLLVATVDPGIVKSYPVRRKFLYPDSLAGIFF